MSHFLFASERAAGCLKGVVDEILVEAKIAQLGERMTEDHKVRCSIHLLGAFFSFAPVAESKAVLLRFHEVDSPIETLIAC